MFDLALPEHVRVVISLAPQSFAAQELARARVKIVELPPLRYEQARQLGSLPSLEQQPRLQVRSAAVSERTDSSTNSRKVNGGAIRIYEYTV
jgi:hypothetical protein